MKINSFSNYHGNYPSTFITIDKQVNRTFIDYWWNHSVDKPTNPRRKRAEDIRKGKL